MFLSFKKEKQDFLHQFCSNYACFFLWNRALNFCYSY